MKNEKRSVRDFYETHGWETNEAGTYKDTAAYVDMRPCMADYHRRAMARIGRLFTGGGRLFLDAGCGAVASREYAMLAASHERRVCVDLSLKALREARTRLDGEVWVVQADITALPFPDACFDGVLCAHVLYHLPPDEQTAGVLELERVRSAQGVGVVVYTWSTCLMTRLALRLNPRLWAPRMPGMRWLWRLFVKRRALAATTPEMDEVQLPDLFFRPRDYAWFSREIAQQTPVKLGCWQSASLPFSQAFIITQRSGTLLLRLLSQLEDWFPELMGRLGAYPLFILGGKRPGNYRKGSPQ